MDELTRTGTVCDVDLAKLQLLATCLASTAVAQAAETFRPHLVPGDDTSPLDASWSPGVFEYAAAVRANLPDGLAVTDFDGVNVGYLTGLS